MNYSGGAPVRQPVRELPENDFPVAPAPDETQGTSHKASQFVCAAREYPHRVYNPQTLRIHCALDAAR